MRPLSMSCTARTCSPPCNPTVQPHRASGPRLRIGQDPRPAAHAGLRGRDRGKDVAAPIQAGRRWPVRRPFADELLRQATPVHRQTPRHRRVLPQPGRGTDHAPPLDQPSPYASTGGRTRPTTPPELSYSNDQLPVPLNASIRPIPTANPARHPHSSTARSTIWAICFAALAN